MHNAVISNQCIDQCFVAEITISKCHACPFVCFCACSLECEMPGTCVYTGYLYDDICLTDTFVFYLLSHSTESFNMMCCEYDMSYLMMFSSHSRVKMAHYIVMHDCNCTVA